LKHTSHYLWKEKWYR